MKKTIISTLCLIGCAGLNALPIGNPSGASLLSDGIFFSPTSCCNGCNTCNICNICSTCNPCNPCFSWFDAWSFRIGFYGDYVFNRHLKIRGRGLERQGRTIQKTQLFTNAGFLALNICNKLDVFGTLGATNLSISTNERSWTLLGDTEGQLEWEPFFSWSAGARGTLFCWNRFALGIEGQYFRTNPRLKKYLSIEDGRYTYFHENNHTSYSEWQAGLGLSYTFSDYCFPIKYVPYIGVKWSWVRLHTHQFNFLREGTSERLTIFNMKADRLWGYAVGFSMTFFDRADLTVEGRFANEKAVHVNGSIRF